MGSARETEEELRLFEARLELEKARDEARAAHAQADERIRTLIREYAEREAALRKEEENDRRRLAQMTVELERARGAARQAEAALRESARQAVSEAQNEAEARLARLEAEFAEREVLLLRTAEEERRARAAAEAELERERHAVWEDEKAARTALQEARAQAEARLKALEADFAEREARLLKKAAEARALPEKLEQELETTRRRGQRNVMNLREAQRRSEQAAKADAEHRLRKLGKELAAREARILKGVEKDRRLIEELKAKLEAEKAALAAARDEVALLKEAPPPAAESFVSPSLEPALDPGWAKLLRLVRPPVESAQALLTRLSTTGLTAGQKTMLRMSAASVAQASEALASIELALSEDPPPRTAASVRPVLESSLASWEAAFRGRGVGLVRLIGALPDAAHDPKELRLVLHHVLRNVLEAVPKGGRLTVRTSAAKDGGLRVEFADDGPGYPAKWLKSAFVPFAVPRKNKAGLGLSIVRRTLRRWGGDAEASNRPGRGALLVLTFPPPAPPAPPATGEAKPPSAAKPS
jgi:signal transduction histidine kinase